MLMIIRMMVFSNNNYVIDSVMCCAKGALIHDPGEVLQLCQGVWQQAMHGTVRLPYRSRLK